MTGAAAILERWPNVALFEWRNHGERRRVMVAPLRSAAAMPARRALRAGNLLAFIGGVAWALCLSPACAQTSGLSPDLVRRVDAAVQQVLAEDQAPSASIAIVRDGHLVYTAAYGYAKLAPAARATTATRYQLASLSKTFVAQAMLLLEQDGALHLDDPVARWLPGLSGGDGVTLRELLQHTSGFPDHYPQTYPAGPRAKATTPDAIIASWGRHPLLFAPGSRFRYSNLNYVIAGRIIEKVSGKALFSFLQERVLEPLGMKATIDIDGVDPGTADVATGYVRAALGPLEPAPEEGYGWSYGAGQLVMTAGDLGRWDEAFLDGRLLAPVQAQAEVTAPTLADGTRSGYALGLFVARRAGRTVYSHVGQGLGFLATNQIYPAERAAIVVLTNDSSSGAYAHIADRLAYLVVPPTTAEAQARDLLRALQAGQVDRRQFSADFDAWFDADRARKFARGLAPLGEPDSLSLRSEDEADGLITRTFDIRVKGQALRLLLQLLPDGRIESLDVQRAG